jgi:hypothetical protein
MPARDAVFLREDADRPDPLDDQSAALRPVRWGEEVLVLALALALAVGADRER